MELQKGLIFNIQRFSIHDGPGIRTTVFLKGCPLRCFWCSNPESIAPYPEFFLNNTRCILCRKCADVCPEGAITIDKNSRKIDRKKCNLCLKCAEVCLTGAITPVGKFLTTEEVLKEVLSDEPFYKNSNGGVTISGGEPLFQQVFTLQLLKKCKEKNLHTALDTTGFANWNKISEILQYVDLVLYDIKQVNPEKHKDGTGIDNKIILENLKKCAERNKVWIRIPLIPDYNDDSENLSKTINLAKEIGAEKVSILPYHEFGKHKYEKLGVSYPIKNIKPLTTGDIQKILGNIDNFGLEVKIGG